MVEESRLRPCGPDCSALSLDGLGLFFTIIVSHPMETPWESLDVSKCNPSRSDSSYNIATRPAWNKEGRARTVFPVLLLPWPNSSPVSVPLSPDLTGNDSLISFIFPPYLASLHDSLSIK